MGLWQTHHPESSVPETIAGPDEYDVALPMGYGESKQVAERLLHLASLEGARANIFRVGQIAGPTPASNGIWTRAEWFSGLVKSSKNMKMIPQSIGTMTEMDWIPVDTLARVMVEIIHNTSSSEDSTLKVFNLANPNLAPVSTAVSTIQKEYAIGDVPYETWLEKVRTLHATLDMTQAQAMENYPVLKLVDFFEGLAQPRDALHMATEQSQKASQTMRGLKPISEIDVKGWLRQWAN